MPFVSRYDKKNIKHKEKEKISNVDYVDRSGYIPLDLQYARLMTAGKSLEDIRDYSHNVDLDKLRHLNEEEFNKVYHNLLDKKLDKTQLDTLLKEKLNKYNQYTENKKEYDRLIKEYHKLEEEKRIKQDAINEYKALLDKENK